MLTKVAGTLALAGVLVALGLAPAAAHAALVGTDPADGSTLDAAPSRVTFTFNETVGNAAVAVTAPDGSSVDVSDVTAVDREVTATVADVDQRGDYTASYRVVSADGHPVEGTITYSVSAGRAVEQKPASEQTAGQDGFIHRHRSHIFWGILAVGIAVVLLLEPIRRRDDPHDT